MRSSHIFLCLLIGVITISQCGALPDLKLFDGDLTSGLRLATNEPCRIACEVADGKGLMGGKAITAYTTDYAKEGDSCYIRFNASRGSINGYTELEFFAKASPIGYDHGFAGILLKDEYETQGPYANIPKIYTRFRFPILNTYDDISLNKLISPFYLELFLVKGEAIYADKVILRSRPFFDIFTDATEYGREKIYSWGDNKCIVKTIGAQAPDGEDVLSVPSGTWGCGLFYSDPYIDLSYFKQIQFQLKSKVDVLIEIEAAGGAKKAITVKKTNNEWKKITLDLYQFGLDLKNTYGPFLITKVGDASSEVQVDEIRYIPPAY